MMKFFSTLRFQNLDNYDLNLERLLNDNYDLNLGRLLGDNYDLNLGRLLGDNYDLNLGRLLGDNYDLNLERLLNDNYDLPLEMDQVTKNVHPEDIDYDQYLVEKPILIPNASSTFQHKMNDILYVVTTVFSPHGYDRRFQLAQEFIDRIEALEKNGQPIALYVVEVIFEDQSFSLQMKHKERHLQMCLPKSAVLWSKEVLINFGVRHLPKDWKYMAWIDADIEFCDPQWPSQAIHKFQKHQLDVLQLFSFAVMHHSVSGPPYSLCTGMYKAEDLWQKKKSKIGKFRHPGFAWAMTHETYNQIGGLLEGCIVGGADHVMATVFLGQKELIDKLSYSLPKFALYLNRFYKKSQGLRLSYLDTIIEHHYHGERKNRMYSRRQDILKSFQYDPYLHLYRDPSSHLLLPSNHFPKKALEYIDQYFQIRKEVKE